MAGQAGETLDLRAYRETDLLPTSCETGDKIAILYGFSAGNCTHELRAVCQHVQDLPKLKPDKIPP